MNYYFELGLCRVADRLGYGGWILPLTSWADSGRVLKSWAWEEACPKMEMTEAAEASFFPPPLPHE